MTLQLRRLDYDLDKTESFLGSNINEMATSALLDEFAVIVEEIDYKLHTHTVDSIGKGKYYNIAPFFSGSESIINLREHKSDSSEQVGSIQEKPAEEIDAAFDLSSLAVKTGISDLSTEHDHYLYGTPKQEIND